MTTFAEMQTAVIEITKRPALVDLTNTAIKLATVRAHSVNFFPRDLTNAVTTYTVVTTSNFTDIENVYDLVPNLRTFKFIQSEDPATHQAVENLEYVQDLQNIWDEDGVRKLSVFTVLGSTLRCSFAAATGRARIWYYRLPDVSSSGYSSWIANAHKEELAMWAAGIVWQRSGYQEQANNVQTQVLTFKEQLVTSYLMAAI